MVRTVSNAAYALVSAQSHLTAIVRAMYDSAFAPARSPGARRYDQD